MIYYDKTTADTAERLKTDLQNGLSENEAKERLKKYGLNELEDKGHKSIVRRFLEQFNDFMIIILLIAAAISFITTQMRGEDDIYEPLIILAIVILNAALGVIQESRAQKSIDHLKKLTAPEARVIREGQEKTIPASALVIGDVIELKAGDVVPADCRICLSNSLTADESALTGESVPVQKHHGAVYTPNTPIGERKNMLMSASMVMTGKCRAVVCAVGMETEMGKIALMLHDTKKVQTPLQKKLASTGKVLGTSALFICLIIFIIGVFRHIPPADMFITAVSLAVAAIPEGLPAIVTIMLAMGVSRLAKHNAIVRNLPAVETLGSATVICTDKTGTITQNKMRVTQIIAGDAIKAITLAALCCDDTPDPTESAILNAAKDRGININTLKNKSSIKASEPFTSKRKRMAIKRVYNGEVYTIVKGAVEYILPLCSKSETDGAVKSMTDLKKNEILNKNKSLASNALRVIALAYKKEGQEKKKGINEENLIFAALIGIEDPPRPESKRAVEMCRKAGIRPVMITGDNAQTAMAVAKKVGIAESDDEVITGDMLDCTAAEMREISEKYNVFARVSPEHKVRIVEAMQQNGHVAAMTGDGVNDAPALKCADIGCSMGMGGTEVARSASDMVLTDDNFATIVNAVGEGRAIYENIKKSVKFLLSSNIGEILTVFMGIVFGFASPLSAVQLLWVNLVTDSLPAIALGLDPCEDEVMHKKPSRNNSKLFSASMWGTIALEGCMIGALALLAFSIGANVFSSFSVGSSMAFAVLSISQLVHAFNMRSEGSVFKSGLFKNPYLWLSLFVGSVMQIAVIMNPWAAGAFGNVQLNAVQWGITAVLSAAPMFIVELAKAAGRIGIKND